MHVFEWFLMSDTIYPLFTHLVINLIYIRKYALWISDQFYFILKIIQTDHVKDRLELTRGDALTHT